jgi:hypothetical protein
VEHRWPFAQVANIAAFGQAATQAYTTLNTAAEAAI